MTKATPSGFTREEWHTVMNDLLHNPSTLNDYRKINNQFYTWNDTCNIENTTHDQAIAYFNYLDNKVEQGNLSKNTAHRYKATLRAIGMRMENSEELYPDFTNPFSDILHNETRTLTNYQDDTFADSKLIHKLLRSISSMPQQKQIILEMMINIGLKPSQIEKLTYSNFSFNPMNQNELYLTFSDGSFQQSSSNDTDTYTKTLDYVAQNGTETWKVTSQWVFLNQYSAKLKEAFPEIGIRSDDTPIFKTARKQPYSYRSIHNLVKEGCNKANIKPSSITPYQLSLYGTVHSYLVHKNIVKRDQLKNSLETSANRFRQNDLRTQIRSLDNDFLELAQNGWIGNWNIEYPASRIVQIRRMKEHMGQTSLDAIVGL